jgi:2-oxo-3-hexenedioate decarboxylase
MTLTAHAVDTLAVRLDDALLSAREVTRLTDEVPTLSLEEAYRIQEAGIARRLSRGERIAGYKMGLTSQAKREQMGLHEAIYGVLTDQMLLGDRMSLTGTIHPKAEPEIAFRTSRILRGEVSRDEALAACDGVCAALEVLDSRFVGFKYFSLPDVVADNASSSRYLLGPWQSPAGLALDRLEMVMSVDGEPVERAVSSAISGDPVLSIVELCRLLASHGRELPAGSIVLAGAATSAVALQPGMRVSLRVDGLPEAAFTVDR